MIAPILHQVPIERILRWERSAQGNAESTGLVHVLPQYSLEAQRIRKTILDQLANRREIGLQIMVIHEFLDAGTNHDLLANVNVHSLSSLGCPCNSPPLKHGSPRAYNSRFASHLWAKNPGRS
jgi:hypothetical protein